MGRNRRSSSSRRRDTEPLPQAALTEGDEILRAFFDQIDIGLAVTFPDGRFVRVNGALCALLGYQASALRQHGLTDLIVPDQRSRLVAVMAQLQAGEKQRFQIKPELLRRDGRAVSGLLTLSVVSDRVGRIRHLLVSFQEGRDLVRTKMALKERTDSLSEVNTALEVLLREREADRLEMKETMLTNAKSLILPYLEKLKSSRLDIRQRTYLNLIESNLNEIISPLTQRMSGHYMNFTPMEIQVANLVKEGQRTKDIAVILGLSVRTIEAVRYRIRMKLGLKRKGTNLRSTLLSMDSGQPVAVQRDPP
ncbi:helix-turn-helix transcriptional regulator [Desulfosarcina ovata]|uniref:PAS domain-containing protein n=1 Tax=Desulfosarcina ovata subsp. ovata TaxID=2752305 RepID=A0A5K8AKR8_9BACT|nr:helix-turn-helix transcriptional regulator [Desulfosarcina ovata]BBO93323.1 hypothetical protein DSCOOX_65030 [Desulfosarcina ovata subsp. ovata]